MIVFSMLVIGINYIFWWKWTSERIEQVICPVETAVDNLAKHGCHSCARYYDKCICPPEFKLETEHSEHSKCTPATCSVVKKAMEKL